MFISRFKPRFVVSAVNAIRKGDFVVIKDSLKQVIDISKSGQGRQGTAYKFDLKELKTQKTSWERYSSGQFQVEIAQVISKKVKFAYVEKDVLVFYDEEYNELRVDLDVMEVPKFKKYLKPDTEMVVEAFLGDVVRIKMPKDDVFVVEKTEDPLASTDGKSDSKRVGYKNAVLDCGANILVPDFIAPGEKIIVNLESDSYVGRAK